MIRKSIVVCLVIFFLGYVFSPTTINAKVLKENVTIESLRNFANDEVEEVWKVPVYYPEKSRVEEDALSEKKVINEEDNIEHEYKKEVSWLTYSEGRASIVYGVPFGENENNRNRYLGYTRNNNRFTNFLFRDDSGGFSSDVADIKWIIEPWKNASDFIKRFKTNSTKGDFSTRVPNKSIKDGLRARFRDFPDKFNVPSLKKPLGNIDGIDWTHYVYVLQPPTKHTWGFGAMAYNGVGGERYQTIPLAPFVPVDLRVTEVRAEPEKAPSGSHIKLVAKVHAAFNEAEQVNGTVLIKGWVEMAGSYTASIESSEWKKIDDRNYEAIKELTVKLPDVRVCGEFPLPAYVEINPIDKFGYRDYEEPDLSNNIGRTTATVESILKLNRSVIKEGYIGWWDSFAVRVEWQERYWIVSGYTCSHEDYSHWVDTSHWSEWETKQATRIYNGWNEAKLDFIPIGYNNIKKEFIPKHQGTRKMKITAPWATDSKSVNMFADYNTIRAGYGFTADILARLEGDYKQPSNIHQGIINSIRLKLGTSFKKTARITNMERINSQSKENSSREVNYNSTETDITGHTETNYVVMGESYNAHGLWKTADRVISGKLNEYHNADEQLWQLPENLKSKDKARKIYIDKSETDGRYTLSGEGLFSNTKGLTTDSEHNRRDIFNIGIYENMYHDIYPEEEEE